MKIQALRQSFENLHRKEDEGVLMYISRVNDLVNQMRALGDKMSDPLAVGKVLRSLGPKYNFVVPAIGESKDLTKLTMDELASSLQAHEALLISQEESPVEKAFAIKSDYAPEKQETKPPVKEDTQGFRGRGRGTWRGRQFNRGRGWRSGPRQGPAESRSPKSHIQCFNCKKFGHYKSECWYNDQSANIIEEEGSSSNLFMAKHESKNEEANEVWLIDSGCSNHMTGQRNLFKDLDENQKQFVKLGDNKEIKVEGRGTVALETHEGQVKLLHNVQFVPNLAHNLLSVGQLLSCGYSVTFDNTACLIIDKKTGKQVASVSKTVNNMFPLSISDVKNYSLNVKGEENTKLWHERFGHLNVNSLNLLKNKNLVHGLSNIQKMEVCEGCAFGKQTVMSFPTKGAWRATKCLELVHTNLVGPMQSESLGGSRYFILFTDDFSRMSWVFFLQSKSQALECFKKFKKQAEVQSECILKVLRSDRGGEYLSKEFTEFCEGHGVRRELSAPYTPQQNGVAERKNRSVIETARSMLRSKGLPNNFWAEAVSTAVYLLNLSPTRALKNMTPFQAWRGFKPTIKHLRVFGSIAYTLIHAQGSDKFDAKSECCILIGYSTESKAYKLYNPATKRTIISRNVIIDEKASWDWTENKVIHTPTALADTQENLIENSSAEPTNVQLNSPPDSPIRQVNARELTEDSPQLASPQEELLSNEMPHRKVRSLKSIYESCSFALHVAEPTNYEEAMKNQVWQQAMQEELMAIEKNNTWELVVL